MPPNKDEPAIENYWQRPDGRKVFLVRFPWGRMRIETRLQSCTCWWNSPIRHKSGIAAASLDFHATPLSTWFCQKAS